MTTIKPWDSTRRSLKFMIVLTEGKTRKENNGKETKGGKKKKREHNHFLSCIWIDGFKKQKEMFLLFPSLCINQEKSNRTTIHFPFLKSDQIARTRAWELVGWFSFIFISPYNLTCACPQTEKNWQFSHKFRHLSTICSNPNSNQTIKLRKSRALKQLQLTSWLQYNQPKNTH